MIISCEKDEDERANGKPINAPAVEPPLACNLPDGFANASFSLQESERSTKEIALEALKDLIAPTNDFIGIKQRLNQIDRRTSEIDTRAQEVQKACLADGIKATDFDLGSTLPGNQNLELKFQCQENFDQNQQMAFGMIEDRFYLIEKNNDSGFAVLTSAPLDGTGVTVWQISADADLAEASQIQAVDGEGFEATYAGTDTSGKTGAITCGVHLNANDTLVYMSASLAASADGCTEVETYCIAAENFADAELSACTDAALDTFQLTSLNPTLIGASKDDLTTALAKKITGYIDFTADAEVPEETAQ
jgi:hypothetical protein